MGSGGLRQLKSENTDVMKKIIFATLLLIGFQGFAQQDPLFSQYMFNKLLLNPAYAGSKEVLSMDLLDRYQWVSIPGAPRTMTFGVHTALRNPHIGLGMYAYRDALGPTVSQGMMATYAYRLIFPSSKLSFGLQAGFKHVYFDESLMNTQFPDVAFTQPENPYLPDVNFGLYYYTNRYFVGISSKQLLQNEMGMVKQDGKNVYTQLLRHFYATAGAAFLINDDLVFRPSLLAKFVKNAPLQLDINASMVFKDLFWVGMSYRSEKAIIFLTEFRIAEKFRVGYSFDLYLNELLTYNKGSHEIRLGVDLELFQSRMLTPRYFF